MSRAAGRGASSLAPVGAELDHLVVAAHSLEQGAEWCERALGAASVPGGKHPAMGTHNRLLNLSGAAFARCYLEIIAIDPLASAPPQPRWFGLDDPALQQRLREAPRLLHFVARTHALDATLAALAALGIDAGRAVAAERASARGLLRWRIAQRADGRLPCGGALPSLIEWGAEHPADHLPASPVLLQSLKLAGVPPAALAVLALPGVSGTTPDGGGALQALLHTPAGRVVLRSDARARARDVMPGIDGGGLP